MRFLYLVVATFLTVTQTMHAKHKKTTSVYLIEEKINGENFTYRLDAIDGIKKEQWSVQGKSVTKDIYNQAVEQAQIEEERKERAAEYERMRHDQDFQETLQTTISKKLIATTIDQIETILTKFDEYQLTDQLRFSAATIHNQATFESIKGYYLTQARELIANPSATAIELQTMLTTLEQYPEKLRLLWENTIIWTVNTCTDTRKLKKLLELMG